MHQKKQQVRKGYFTRVAIILLSSVVLMPVSELVSAQQGGLRLEEVIVTAQRREQTLQEVPISVGVYSGTEISLQGYRKIEELAKFSASVSLLDNGNRVNTTIRGFGTLAGASQTLISATPTFVDGIHYGADEMVKNAFLDVERVEVLKGPQPLHFGMNATAGAINIESRRPTPEWEGNLTAEFGNDGKRELEGAFGGPLTETLGIRFAGIIEEGDGPLKNRVDGGKFPHYDNLGGRVMLEWTPTDRLNVLAKFDISRQRNGVTADSGCLTEGEMRGFPADSPIEGGVIEGIDLGGERSIWANPPKGVSQNLGLLSLPTLETGQDCFQGEYGFSREGPYIAPPANVVEENSSSLFDGAIDPRAAADAFTSRNGQGGPGVNGTDIGGIRGNDDVDSWNALLDIDYTLVNGININSQTGAVSFLKNNSNATCQCPFFFGFNGRQMEIDQYSQQVRVTSPGEGFDMNVDIPGGLNLEFMVGGFWQTWQRDMFNSALASNVRRAQRLNKVWEDATWYAGFWNLTFNFMDRQLSIDVGGRYTDVHKEIFLRGLGGQWVFDEIPCDSDGLDVDPATCTADPDFKWVNPDLSTFTSFDASNTDQTVSEFGDISEVRVDSPRILIDQSQVNMGDLWTVARWRDTTDVPLNWRSPGGVKPVGLTAPVYNRIREGPWGPCATCISPVVQDANNYDSQFVIRYTPNALNGNHTFYGKYAEAFKGPVTDTGQSTIPGDLDTIVFEPEFSQVWEIGAKGTLLGGRVRYGITAFMNEFTDLQLSGEATQFDPTEQQSVALNAGQDVDGIEFNLQAAVTQNLTLNLAGALMDATMKNLDGGGCSPDELIAASVDVVGNDGGQRGSTPTADELDFANEILTAMGPTRRATVLARAGSLPESFFINGGCRMENETTTFEGEEVVIAGRETINRDGEQAALAPDWKFVLGLNYTRPVLDGYEIFLDAKGFIADDSILTASVFDRTVKLNSGHGDVNITAGFGDRDGTWRVAGFVRNLLEDTPSFNPAWELENMGFITAGQESEVRGLPASSFRSYGVRVEYNF